jgi:hypothetical protein
VDVGTSGGVWGLERGYCQMIGGEKGIVEHLGPIFKSLAPGRGDISRTPGREKVAGTAEEGYLHCGPSGAGHFVKMVHNGIEYGLMAAYAEGLNILKHANAGSGTREVDAETTPLRNPEHYRYDFPLADVAEVWSSRRSNDFLEECRIPGKGAGRFSRRSNQRSRRPSLPRRCINVSSRGAKTILRRSSCPRCGFSLAGIWRRRRARSEMKPESKIWMSDRKEHE